MKQQSVLVLASPVFLHPLGKYSYKDHYWTNIEKQNCETNFYGNIRRQKE